MEFAWYATYVTLWAIVLLGGLVVVGLVRTVYRLEHRVEMSLQRAGKAPDFTGLDLAGNRVDSAELAGSQYGLLFVKPSCIACEQSLTTLSPIRRRAGENLLIVCEGDRDECMNLTSGADGAIRTVIDRGGEIGRRFGVGSVPMVIVVGKDGWIRSQGQLLHGDADDDLTRSRSAAGPDGGEGNVSA